MAASLRERLSKLATQRTELEGQLHDVRRATGAALLEVKGIDGLTLTEAAGILGLSRPTAYRLLEDEGGSA